MTTISWNCRRIGRPWNFQFLKDFVRHERPSFIFLCETLAKKDKLEWVRIQLGFEGLFVVEPDGRSGGLALLWKDSEQENLMGFSQYHIDVEVNIEGMRRWRLTGVYGEPNRSQRRKTWDLLRHLARDSNLPWCVVGDLNNVIAQSDKNGGHPYPRWLIDGFNEAIQEARLIDMNIVGRQFTWEKGAGTDDYMEVRLDRALSSNSWLQEFPVAKLYNLEGSEVTESDHCPILLVPQKVDKINRSCRFRFENAWLLDPMCKQIVKDGWEGEEGLSIQQKIKACSEKLWVWGREVT